MKNETASREIELLDYYLQNHTNDYSEKSHTAMMTAIKALEQEPCEDAISRQAVLDLIEHYNSDGLGSVFYGYEEGVKFADAVNKLPPVNSKELKTGHCEDCISRTEAIDYLWSAINDLQDGDSVDPAWIKELLEELPSVKPVSSTEDCISREAAIDAIMRYLGRINWDFEAYRGTAKIILNHIPSVRSERKKGRWIKKDYWKPLPFDVNPLDWDNYDEKTHSEKVSHLYCSECDADKGEIQPTVKFCEDCGTEMESGDK